MSTQKVKPPIRVFNLPFFGRVIVLCLLIIGLISMGIWVVTSELFSIPEDVSQARTVFHEASDRYFTATSYWDIKKKTICSEFERLLQQSHYEDSMRQLEQVTHEIIISLLVQDLKFTKKMLENVAVVLNDTPNRCILSISKFEKSIWPLKIMLSLEMEFRMIRDKVVWKLLRVRRGLQNVPIKLGWMYFAAELKTLSLLETIQNSLKFSESEGNSF